MKRLKVEKDFEPVFDESYLHAARFENESYKDYKIRQKENYRFWKHYRRFGKEAVLAFKKFVEMLQLQEQEKMKVEAAASQSVAT